MKLPKYNKTSKNNLLRQEGGGQLNIGYLIRQGLQNRKKNRSGARASVAVLFVCLLLLGGVSLLAANILNVINDVQKENIIMVFANYDATKRQVDALGAQIVALENVAAVEFISKEEALERQLASMKVSSSSALVQKLPKNPMPDSYSVTVSDMKFFAQVVDALEKMPNVENIREDRELAGQLTGLSRAAGGAGLAVVLALVVGSLLVVMNTTSLSMQKSEDAIKVMRAVGSTERDIRIPYLVEGILNGLIAGVLAFSAIGLIYALVVPRFGSLTNAFFTGQFIPFSKFILPLIGTYVLIGILTGYLGCRFSVHTYFRDKKKEPEIEL